MNRIKFALAVAFLSVSVLNARSVNAATDGDTQVNHALAVLSEDEQDRRDIALKLAPVKSAAALAEYMKSVPSDQSPLSALSPGAKARFINGLTFNEKGLTSYNYADLKAELTASQIYQLLSLFGVQHTTPLIRGARVQNDTDRAILRLNDNADIVRPLSDYGDYKCVTMATCGRATDFICIGQNCAKE